MFQPILRFVLFGVCLCACARERNNRTTSNDDKYLNGTTHPNGSRENGQLTVEVSLRDSISCNAPELTVMSTIMSD